MLPYSREEARDWTRAHLQGVNNVVIPSYSSDLRSLNEEGIRHDVRLQVDYGFTGFLLVSETSITPDEYIEFAEIAADESAGRQLLIHHASFNTLEENVEMAARAAEAGAALTLLSYPPSLYATSEDDIEGYTRAFCEQVDMAVMLFPVPLWGFEHVHPASLSADLMERLIDDLPTVAAIKAEGGHPSLGGFVESWNRLSDQVVVTMPLEHQAIPLAMLVPMQAIATSNTEYTGRTIPQIFDMVRDGKHDGGMAALLADGPGPPSERRYRGHRRRQLRASPGMEIPGLAERLQRWPAAHADLAHRVQPDEDAPQRTGGQRPARHGRSRRGVLRRPQSHLRQPNLQKNFGSASDPMSRPRPSSSAVSYIALAAATS